MRGMRVTEGYEVYEVHEVHAEEYEALSYSRTSSLHHSH